MDYIAWSIRRMIIVTGDVIGGMPLLEDGRRGIPLYIASEHTHNSARHNVEPPLNGSRSNVSIPW